MEYFDVVIVGAGPSGLRCAEILQNTTLRVLVLEKNIEIGPKICAGGITKDFFRIYSLPNELIEFKSNSASITFNGHEIHYEHIDDFLFTINRKELAKWQLSRIKAPNITIQTEKQVTNITGNVIEINRKNKIGFKYLVGADGANSLVRRHLNITSGKRIITFQYTISSDKMKTFEFEIDKRLFGDGYAWVFPHGKYYTVGCGAVYGTIHPQQLKINFHQWLKNKKINTGNAKLESFPILFDYKGYNFKNIFLAGEAAGLTSGLSGEGIYPAIISGQAVAELINGQLSDFTKKKMDTLIRNKKNETWYFSIFLHSGIIGNILINATMKLLKYPSFQKFMWKNFP